MEPKILILTFERFNLSRDNIGKESQNVVFYDISQILKSYTGITKFLNMQIHSLNDLVVRQESAVVQGTFSSLKLLPKVCLKIQPWLRLLTPVILQHFVGCLPTTTAYRSMNWITKIIQSDSAFESIIEKKSPNWSYRKVFRNTFRDMSELENLINCIKSWIWILFQTSRLTFICRVF